MSKNTKEVQRQAAHTKKHKKRLELYNSASV